MNKTDFYISNCTWGIIMTLIGAVVAAVMVCLGHKPTRHGGCFCFEVGKNWGAISLGLVIVCSKGSDEHIKNHEFGHSVQNMYFGPLFIFLVAIPSFVRCQYYNWIYTHRPEKAYKLPDYESIWFERDATQLGIEAIKYW